MQDGTMGRIGTTTMTKEHRHRPLHQTHHHVNQTRYIHGITAEEIHFNHCKLIVEVVIFVGTLKRK